MVSFCISKAMLHLRKPVYRTNFLGKQCYIWGRLRYIVTILGNNLLATQGYPNTVVNDPYLRARGQDKEQLIRRDQIRRTNNNICFALNFIPQANKMKRIVFRHWYLLNKIAGSQSKPTIGFRHTQSIRYMLTHWHAALGMQALPVKGHYRCRHYICCKLVWDTDVIDFPELRFTKHLEIFTTCENKIAIYLIICAYQLK